MRRVPVLASSALGFWCLVSSPLAQAAPARQPPAPAAPYVLKTAASLAEIEKSLGGEGAHGADIVKPGGPIAVEVVWKHEKENDQKELEVHEGRDHVFYVTDGKATFKLGGELDGAHEISPGEWRAPKSKNSQTVELKKGDLVFIPHGTPHWRSTKGSSNFTMLQISFWPGGAPAVAAAAATPPAKK
jgi:mannose-6-phosphate isomerase-like protein (cupin superfamily)